MAQITVHLLKPDKGYTVTYAGELVRAEPGYALVRARWERDRLELGYVAFETGDVFLEHFFAARWYNVFELRSAAGALKGWYCNVTRPAQIGEDVIVSEDLALDLFVPPSRAGILRLDEDEFEALGLAAADPATHAAGYAALDELERLASAGEWPFDSAA
jgi:predicted RNA-binding protein associated with RNAse of E/G family